MTDYDDKLTEMRLGPMSADMHRRYTDSAVKMTNEIANLKEEILRLRDALGLIIEEAKEMQASPIYGHLSRIEYVKQVAVGALKNGGAK